MVERLIVVGRGIPAGLTGDHPRAAGAARPAPRRPASSSRADDIGNVGGRAGMKRVSTPSARRTRRPTWRSTRTELTRAGSSDRPNRAQRAAARSPPSRTATRRSEQVDAVEQRPWRRVTQVRGNQIERADHRRREVDLPQQPMERRGPRPAPWRPRTRPGSVPGRARGGSRDLRSAADRGRA